MRTLAMILKTDPKYPNRRAYVLGLSNGATPEILAGRVENLVTGQQFDFASAQELINFIASDIGESDPPSGL